MKCDSSESHIVQMYLHDRSILSELSGGLFIFQEKITKTMRGRTRQVIYVRAGAEASLRTASETKTSSCT